MFYWSSKRGQLRDFDAQAKTIFTDEEPEGVVSDQFPDKKLLAFLIGDLKELNLNEF